MNDLIRKFMEAHIEYELSNFKDCGYKNTIKEEISAIFNWLKKVKLKNIVTPEQILGLIQRNVVELPVAGGVTELSGEMSRIVMASIQSQKFSLEDIFARNQFDDIVDKIVSLKNIRNELIHKFLTSSAYSDLISDVLYNGIKEYLLTENIIAQKIPGVSSLIKMGKEAFHKVPDIEASIEAQVKNYIKKNFEKTIQLSERSLIEYFDEIQIVEVCDEIWDSIAKNRLSEYYNKIDVNDLEDFIIIGYDFWNNFRKTQYFEGIYTELVYYFFEKYGDNYLDVLLKDVGVSEEVVIYEVIEIVSPGIEKAIEIGYLEERIRARLASFYLSEKAASLVSW